MAKRFTKSAAGPGHASSEHAAAGGFDFGKAMGSFSIPGLDVETMAKAQRKNVEALTAVCQLAFDCAQQSARRQAELFRDTAEEMMSSFRKVSVMGNPQDQMASQAEIGRQALEKGMTSLRELAELAARTNAEAFDILNRRAAGCLEEFQQFVIKNGQSR
jgi:phasin family protein